MIFDKVSAQSQRIPVTFDPSSLIDDIEFKPDYTKTSWFDCLILILVTVFVVYGGYKCVGVSSSSPREEVSYYEDSRRNTHYHDVSYRSTNRGYYN